jgi:D-amino-acid dehydrogenase
MLFWRSATQAHVRNSMSLLFDLCIRSLRLYEELAHQGGLQFDLQRRGIVNLFRSERGKAAAAEEGELSHRIGFPAELLDADGLRKLQPGIEFTATGGLYFPGDAHLDPEKFLQAMTTYLTGHGVRILTDEEVTGMVPGPSPKVLTGRHEVLADSIVIAGGAWSPGLAKMLGLRLLVQAGKGYSLTIPRPPHCPTIPMILTESRVALTPFAEAFRLGGTMELAGVDLSITARRVQAIIDAVPLYLANVDVGPARTEQPWAGLRPVSPDGLPFIGRLRRHPGVVVATGHAMIGVTLAPVTGSLVTEILTTGTTSVPIGPLDPGRFD